MDEMTFTLNNPLTEEEWDLIEDVDFEHTNSITFHTKHGKEVEFVKRKTGRWVDDGGSIFFGGMRHYLPMICSCCGRSALNEPWNYCPNCGAKMGDVCK